MIDRQKRIEKWIECFELIINRPPYYTNTVKIIEQRGNTVVLGTIKDDCKITIIINDEEYSNFYTDDGKCFDSIFLAVYDEVLTKRIYKGIKTK